MCGTSGCVQESTCGGEASVSCFPLLYFTVLSEMGSPPKPEAYQCKRLAGHQVPGPSASVSPLGL